MEFCGRRGRIGRKAGLAPYTGTSGAADLGLPKPGILMSKSATADLDWGNRIP